MSGFVPGKGGCIVGMGCQLGNSVPVAAAEEFELLARQPAAGV